MSTKKTKAELLEEIAALKKQVAGYDKFKLYETAATETKTMHTALMEAGFSDEQAFDMVKTLLYTQLIQNMVKAVPRR